MFCVNCGNQLIESAKFCPNCGTAVQKHEPSAEEMEALHKARIAQVVQEVHAENQAKNKRKEENSEKAKDTLRYIFTLEWIDDFYGFLSDLPVGGGCLSVLWIILLLIVECGICVAIFMGLYSLTGIWGILVIGNIVAFFASYVWRKRKWWLFPIILILSIVFLAFSMGWIVI